MLTMLNHEQNIVSTYFQHCRQSSGFRRVTKSRIKEPCVMSAQFTTGWIECRHFCCLIGMDGKIFLRPKQVEFLRIQEKFPAIGNNRLPEFFWIVMIDLG